MTHEELLETAILRTILYADVFDFPMTVQEIHHFLIHDQPVDLEQVRHVLVNSGRLNRLLYRVNGYVCLADREPLIALREAREEAAQRLWPKAVRYGWWLARLPFVRMVALTGALSVRNVPNGDDDLDYMLVTAPHRVWLARAFAILLVRVARLRGVEICPNYVVAETALSQERRNVFTAHEVAQTVPLYGRGLYQRLLEANMWVVSILPNARMAFYDESQRPPGRAWRLLKQVGEAVLGGWLGDQLEHWEYRRKLRRFAPAMQTPHSAARLDEQQIKGHFQDHGHPTLVRYHERLRRYGLETGPG